MKTREIDVHDDAVVSSYYAIMRAAELYGREAMPFWSERELRVMLQREEPGEIWRCFAAFEPNGSKETMVGTALLVLPMIDNTTVAFVDVDVAPQYRQRGVGSALAELIVRQARSAGRTRVMTEVHLAFEDRDQHPYRSFAEHRGFRLANIEVRRVLDLPVADEQLSAWIGESAPHHPNYSIETFVDDIPQALIPSLVDVHNQLALDAPTGDLEFEAEAMTPEGFEIRRAKIKEMGRTVYETVALTHDRQVVAQSAVGVSEDDPENVFQWGTLVRREHRGHRLGMAVKAANLRVVQAAHPEKKRIVTTNSEDNVPMVAINELMGFKPVELLAEFQIKFDDAQAE